VPNSPAELRAEILRLTREYSAQTHRAQRPGSDAVIPFVPGETVVPYAGRVFDTEEVAAAVASTLDFWLTLGPEGEAFELELAAYLGVRHSLLVNSGSSANLIAFATLTSPKLPPPRRIRRGDEVITVAAGFPTTVAPLVQHGVVPVFIDNDPATGNARVDRLEDAYRPGRTKAVMMAHTLGNPFDVGAVLAFCRRHELWLVEDNCDALGCTYSLPAAQAAALGVRGNSPGFPVDGGLTTRFTGTWGDLSTQSFYPPHHLTMGEGGAVNIVSRPPLKTYAESFRDWGRDCWCASGKDNTCNKRFGWRLGELPEGYDHKYIYSHVGYNLKPLDPQAAIGRAQLRKLPAFVAARKANWEYLRAGLAELEDYFAFSLPTHATGWSPAGFTWDASGARTDCSWFGFMVRVRASAPFSRTALARHLDERKIGNRMLFGGNLVRQPAFVQLKRDHPDAFRVEGDLAGADELMNQALFLGTYPGLTKPMLDYVIDVIRSFVRKH
jgi:CDP-6-deoxy-D-xylo-4-hexulose-3-dehydrase